MMTSNLLFILIALSSYPQESNLQPVANPQNCSISVCNEPTVLSVSECTENWGNCFCVHGDNTMVTCPNYFKQFIYRYNNEKLTIDGSNTTGESDNVLRKIAQLLEPLSVREFFLISLQNEMAKALHQRKQIEKTTNCNSQSGNESLPVFSLNYFAVKTEMKIFKMVTSGFEKIEGDFINAFPALRSLTVTNSFIRTISETAFHGLKYLQHLDLSDNRISLLTRSYFKDLEILRTMNLENNCLERLQPDLFHDLGEMIHLNMAYNKLVELPLTLFEKNRELKVLRLEFNSIEELPSSIFSSTINLQRLTFDHNKLTTLDEDIFSKLHNLEFLVLSHNRLKIIPEGLCQYNPRLIMLWLDSNPLQKIPSMKGAIQHGSRKPWVNIANASITEIHLPLSPFFRRTETIWLTNNCIRDIQEDYSNSTSTNHQFTEMLLCSNCCLTEIPHTLLTNVNVTSLAKNAFSALAMNDLKHVVHLQEIDLSLNDIRHIDIQWSYPIIQDNTKHIPNPTTRIFLDLNPIVCDCDLFNFLLLVHNDTSLLAPNSSYSNMYFGIENLTCFAPPALKGQRVKELKPNDLDCPELTMI